MRVLYIYVTVPGEVFAVQVESPRACVRIMAVEACCHTHKVVAVCVDIVGSYSKTSLTRIPKQERNIEGSRAEPGALGRCKRREEESGLGI